MKALKILILLIFISMANIPAYASSLRLMAMGDMQGIVEDESDYINDISSLLRVKENIVQLDLTSSGYVLSDQGAKTGDFESFNGNRDISSFSTVLSLSKELRLFFNSIGFDDENTASINDPVTPFNDKASLEFNQSVIGVGYMPSSEYIIGAGLESYSEDFSNEKIDPSSGVNEVLAEIEEKGTSYDQFYSVGYNGPKWYWGFSYSDPTYNIVSTRKTADYVSDIYVDSKIRNTGPIRSNAIICVKDIFPVFNGNTDLKLGNYVHNTPLSAQGRRFVGLEYRSSDDKLLAAFGAEGLMYIYPWDSNDPSDLDNYVDITSTNLGIEYKYNESLSLRSGIRSKSIYASYISGDHQPYKLFYDYSVGISYALSNYIFELALVNYQGYLADYNEFKDMNLDQISGDNVLLSDQRSWGGAFGMTYRF